LLAQIVQHNTTLGTKRGSIGREANLVPSSGTCKAKSLPRCSNLGLIDDLLVELVPQSTAPFAADVGSHVAQQQLNQADSINGNQWLCATDLTTVVARVPTFAELAMHLFC
jgi:hypothetical protein